MVLGNLMTFNRYGRSLHLRIESAEDLARAVELDEAHWVATSAPVGTVNCDPTFLQLLDTDANGRVTCHDVRAAIQWLLQIFSDHSGITEAATVLCLDSLNTDDPAGQKIHTAATKMLRSLDQPDAPEISIDQIRRIRAQVESTPVSEAGVVLPTATDDPEIAQFITDVLATVGGVDHPSATQGINQAKLDDFLSQIAAFLQWHKQGQIPPGSDKTDIMPLGSDTPAAFAALAAIRAKIDQYFAQSRALALEGRFIERMSPALATLQELDLDDPAVIDTVLRQAPLAKPSPTDELCFADQFNPYYTDALADFQRLVVNPVLKDSAENMTARQWQQIKNFFAAHHAWSSTHPDRTVEPLGLEKLRAYQNDKYAKVVKALIAESAETAFVLDNIRLTEKAALFQAHMLDLANNFVSFPHLYDTQSRAMFEMGTLVMDGRRFNLAVNAVNRAEHAKIAQTSNMFVLYVEIVSKQGQHKYEVAVPVTSGSKGNLCLGKRGVFYDLAGREANAVVVAIIENPISLTEALVAPFLRLGRMLTGKIESITAEAEKQFDKKASSAMTQATAAAPPGTSTPVPAQAQGFGGSTSGLLLGGGVALAALGSALAYITKTLANTHPLAITFGILGAILAVMIPISIVAILKLRKRDVSAILEGSGWAINARMRLTRRQGRFFTQRPPYPLDSIGLPSIWLRKLVAIIVILAILAGAAFLFRTCMQRPSSTSTEESTEKIGNPQPGNPTPPPPSTDSQNPPSPPANPA